jgi:hypothetical protein
VINAIKFSIGEIEASDQYLDHTTDDLTGIAHIEVDVWVILRRLIPNALELAAANAHDRYPGFIMKFWITVHVQHPAYALDR